MFGRRLKLKELLYLNFCLMTLTGTTCGQTNDVVKVFVPEGHDVMLPCSLSTKENIERNLFDWIKDGQDGERIKRVFLYDNGLNYNNGRSGQSEEFKGRVSHFEEQLKHEFVLKDRSGEIKGAAPKLFLTIVDVTKSGVLLQCDVRDVFPQPKLQWKDSDGNILPAEEPQVSHRGGRYNVTLQINVTKTTTNSFHCVAVQEDIHHMIDDDITVSDQRFKVTSTKEVSGWLAGFCLGVLILAAVLALLVATICIIKRRKRGFVSRNIMTNRLQSINLTDKQGGLHKTHMEGGSTSLQSTDPLMT